MYYKAWTGSSVIALSAIVNSNLKFNVDLNNLIWKNL
jgi:hypothetical protein